MALKSIKYEVPIYLVNVLFQIGSVEEIIADRKKLYDIDENVYRGSKGVCTTGLKDLRGREIVYIWLKHFNNDTESISTLVHEIMHLTFYTLSSRGIKYSDESEEAFTYLTGTIVREFLNRFNKLK